jgi:hypothetical protein
VFPSPFDRAELPRLCKLRFIPGREVRAGEATAGRRHLRVPARDSHRPVLFAVCWQQGFAIARGDTHKCFMVVAAVSMSPPAISRWPTAASSAAGLSCWHRSRCDVPWLTHRHGRLSRVGSLGKAVAPLEYPRQRNQDNDRSGATTWVNREATEPRTLCPAPDSGQGENFGPNFGP